MFISSILCLSCGLTSGPQGPEDFTEVISDEIIAAAIGFSAPHQPNNQSDYISTQNGLQAIVLT